MIKRTLSHKECSIFRQASLITKYEQCWEISKDIFLARDRRTGNQRYFKWEKQ
jgi:hypothetical protein